MVRQGGMLAVGSVTFVALALLLAPATAATSPSKSKARSSPSFTVGGFTPAVADPKLAAEFARRGFQVNSFRFTPSTTSVDRGQDIRVAIRARSATPAQAIRAGEAGGSAVTAITPLAYNLGVAVGWRRFALSGDVAKVQGGPLPGGREAAEVGVSYLGKKFSGRVLVGADRTDTTTPPILPQEENYSLDVGGSYSVARNLSVTGGVRYKIQRERLETLADERRDSQAVYIGTAFRF